MNYLPLHVSVRAVLSLLTIVAIYPISSDASDIHVGNHSDLLNPGDGTCTLREAVMNANENSDVTGGDCTAGSGTDVIVLSNGTYPLTAGGLPEDFNTSGDLDITDHLTIRGAGAATTIIDANSIDRVFDIHGPITVVFEDVTIRGGYATGLTAEEASGGGIRATGLLGLTITDAVIAENTSDEYGGGVFVDLPVEGFGEVLNITGSTLIGNTAGSWGGAIASRRCDVTVESSVIGSNTMSGVAVSIAGGGGMGLLNVASVQLNETQIIDNIAADGQEGGGGIWAQEIGSLWIQDGSVLAGNESRSGSNWPGDAGGAWLDDISDLRFRATEISDNTADRDGGGLYIKDSNPGTASSIDFVNSTVSGNTAGGNGGGLFIEGPTGTIRHLTFAGNGAGMGGGLYASSADVTVLSTIMSGNSAPFGGPDCFSWISSVQSGDYNLIGSFDCNGSGAVFVQPNDMTEEDPMLLPLADNGGPNQTHALMVGSPAFSHIPNGVNGCGSDPSSDQRGELRPGIHGTAACEIGAWEAQEALLPVELLSFSATEEMDRNVMLEWSTSDEQSNEGFAIEHKPGSDGAYEEIGFVHGGGNTREGRVYRYRTAKMDPGLQRFRLKQIDFDGTATYSNIVELTIGMPGRYLLEPAYPNPFNPQTAIRFGVHEAEPVQILLFDITGRMLDVLYDRIPDGGEMQEVRLDGSALPSGLYLVKLQGADFVASQKVVLVK